MYSIMESHEYDIIFNYDDCEFYFLTYKNCDTYQLQVKTTILIISIYALIAV